MNKLFGLLAAAFLAVTPVAAAMADDHAGGHAATEAMTAPADEAAAAATTTEAAPVVTQEVTLQNGTKVMLENDKAFVVDAEGNKLPAPDGDHVLADGTTMTVKEGTVTAGLPTPPAAAPTEVQGESTGMAPEAAPAAAQ